MLSARSTLLIPQFPRRLRLQVRALANLQGRKMQEVFPELIEQALARTTLATAIKRGGEKR